MSIDRTLIRCELDAAYIRDTFPIVRRKDNERHGLYCTKDTILEIHAALAEAQDTPQPYQRLARWRLRRGRFHEPN